MPARAPDATVSPAPPTRSFSLVIGVLALTGAAYEAVLLLTSLLAPYRFPIPYAVPIFDAPFALVALGVGYLCVERHRLRQDSQSAALGGSLALTGLLALAHIASQPDYPGRPGMDAGIAPYFFFLSYLGGFVGIGLAAALGDHPLALSDRARLASVIGVAVASALIVLTVFQVKPLLPSLVMKPGRLTPFACWSAGALNGVGGVWALGRARRRMRSREHDWFAGLFLIAGFIWMLGLIGFFLHPYRYAVSWYVAGLARPVGVGVIFVALLREQVWLYREARARLHDLETLHEAGQALVMSLDPAQTLETVASRALAVSGASGVVLYRVDAAAQVLQPVACAGTVPSELTTGLDVPVGQGTAGLSVRERRPIASSSLAVDADPALPAELRDALQRAGFRAVLAVPLLVKVGDPFGAVAAFYRESRAFAETDVELLSTFGTQASVALENARSFEQLTVKARHDGELQAFGQRLLQATTEDAILSDAVALAHSLVVADFVSVFLLDAGANTLRLVAGLGWEPGLVGVLAVPPSAESFAGYAFVHKAPVEVGDLTRDRSFVTPPHLTGHGVRAGMMIPLGVHEQPVGVLGVYYRRPHRFSDEESRVLTSIGHQTALALDKVHLYAELQANLARLKETQAQLIRADKLTALGTLLSGMAHELNNPLSTIQLSVQLMKRQPLSDGVRRRMDAVEEECERASRIIKDLLMFARRKPPERRSVDVNRVVKGVLALQAPDLELSKIRVISDLAPMPTIMADGHQLQQVFLNLFTNARHAMTTARGEGTLTIRSRAVDDRALVTVEDDGPGIAPEHLGRIFDPFFTTKGAGEGTGLGLSLSIGIVEAHGGRITAESQPGGGARFTVSLPLGDDVRRDTSAPRPDARTAGRRGRVLLIDDEGKLRATLTEVLTAMGHTVESAATGHEALAKIARAEFDVIALDLRLPDVDGKAVWQRLVAEDAEIAGRIFFMTGDTMSPDTQAFLQQAGRPVVTKPFTIDRIGSVIDQLLDAPGVAR